MRVLVIEDDPRIARDITRALEASGYVVESVSDGGSMVPRRHRRLWRRYP